MCKICSRAPKEVRDCCRSGVPGTPFSWARRRRWYSRDNKSRCSMLAGKLDEAGTGRAVGSPMVSSTRLFELLSFSCEAMAPTAALRDDQGRHNDTGTCALDNCLDILFCDISALAECIIAWIVRRVIICPLANVKHLRTLSMTAHLVDPFLNDEMRLPVVLLGYRRPDVLGGTSARSSPWYTGSPLHADSRTLAQPSPPPAPIPFRPGHLSQPASSRCPVSTHLVDRPSPTTSSSRKPRYIRPRYLSPQPLLVPARWYYLPHRRAVRRRPLRRSELEIEDKRAQRQVATVTASDMIQVR